MQNSFPDPHKYSAMNYHVLCLDTLLMFIDHMVERVDYEVSMDASETLRLPINIGTRALC